MSCRGDVTSTAMLPLLVVNAYSVARASTTQPEHEQVRPARLTAECSTRDAQKWMTYSNPDAHSAKA